MMAVATAESPTTVLPEELMIEILSRVESSNPLQLRCVCKFWNSLLLDDQFVKNHIHKSLTEISDLLSTSNEHYKSFNSHQIPNVPEEEDDDEEEEEDAEEAAKRARMNRLAELDNLLVVVRSIKRELEIIKVDTLAFKDRMKCLESFLKIYLKSATSSSSSQL